MNKPHRQPQRQPASKPKFEPRLSRDRTTSTGRMQMLDTWQFVRVMVALEERGKRGALWQHWAATWRELDAELTSLAETEFDAYSTLMMRHRLELSLPTPALKMELIANIRIVVKQLNDKCREKGLAPSQRQDMQFEASELKNLLRELDPPPPTRVDQDADPDEINTPEEQTATTAKTGKRDQHGKSGPGLQRGKAADKRNTGRSDAGKPGSKQRVKRPRSRS